MISYNNVWVASPNELGVLFPLDNVGSASNYIFMHLCVYSGLHQHVLNINENQIPKFLFLDPPSSPYYVGKNNDKTD
ncbi:MAG: DUF3732 domain-containing protein [Bacteroidales bacterium]|nr:DUF3732 domain-containing protein [Bacteroidales bacterium]